MAAATDHVVLPCVLPSWPTTKAALSGSFASLDDLVALLKSVAVEKDVEPAFFEQYLAETADGTSDGSLSSASTLKLLPFIQQLALSMEDLFPTPVPLLRKGCPNTVTLSRLQVASILAHAFFCTWPQDTRGSTFPHINFDALFRATMGPSLRACKCLLHYFQRLQERPALEGNIIIHRKVMDKLPDAEWWASSEKGVGKTVVMISGSIEQDEAALYHADFANKLIGGGTLTGGSAQEEMLFLQKPECIVAMLLCEEMEANEAIVISGAEQFCSYSGKGRSKVPFSFGGDHNDATVFDPELQCLARHIVAVDATTGQGMTQYLTSNVLRDINKLYVGLRDESNNDSNRPLLATGHWGCGAYAGNKQLKAIQQMIAASEAGMDLHYYAFGDRKFCAEFQPVVDALAQKKQTVGRLCQLLLEATKTEDKSVFEYLLEKLSEGNE